MADSSSKTAAPAAPAAAAPAAKAPKAPETANIFGGGVLSRNFKGLYEHYDTKSYNTEKLVVTSSSTLNENTKLKVGAERTHAGVIDASAHVTVHRGDASFSAEGKASGSLSGKVSLANVKGVKVEGHVKTTLDCKNTEATSSLDYKNTSVTTNLTLKYPLGGRLSADGSALTLYKGVLVGGRAVASSGLKAGDWAKLDSYEASAGYRRDNVQVALSANSEKIASVGVAVDVNASAKVAAAVSANVASKSVSSVQFGGRFARGDHVVRVRANIPSLSTAEVAVQLASQLHKDLHASVSGGFNLGTKKPAFGLNVDLTH